MCTTIIIIIMNSVFTCCFKSVVIFLDDLVKKLSKYSIAFLVTGKNTHMEIYEIQQTYTKLKHDLIKTQSSQGIIISDISR